MQEALQHEAEIRTQDDENALRNIDDLKHSENQGQSRGHQSIDAARENSQYNSLDN